MIKVIFTLDYEIHGNGDGCPHALMVEPTARMLDVFGRHGAKLTIMADVAEILKFREYRDQFGRDDYYYESVVAQLKDAIRRGHDVQLHLHCSYFNARFEAGRWVQDWTEYNFAGLSETRLSEVVRIGKEFLEEQLRPIDPNYRCDVFRAANWAVSPSRSVVRALVNNGFQIDTSVFKYGRREGIVSFDYTNAHSDLVPWPVDENDICRRNDAGKLVEVPIYCERRWIGAFLTPNRVRRVLMTRGHPVASEYPEGDGMATGRSSPAKKVVQKLSMLTRSHAWKADFNQCTGRQLTRALKRASRIHDPEGREQIPFVLIGHSKLFTEANERSLTSFLDYVVQNPTRFQFGTFHGVGVGRFPKQAGARQPM